MNKTEFVAAVAEATGQTKAQTGALVDAVIATLTKTLRKGESVSIVGFGSFQVRKRAARIGRNPQSGEPVKIKASKAPAFKPGKAFKDAIAK